MKLGVGLPGLATTVGLFVGVVTCSTMASCGAEPSKEGPRQVRRVFVHGSPDSLLQGATADSQSFLSASELSTLGGYDFSSGLVLSEFSPLSADNSTAPESDFSTSSAVERASRLTESPQGLGVFAWRASRMPTTESAASATGRSGPSGPRIDNASDNTWDYVDSSSGLIALRGTLQPDGRLGITEILGIPVTMIHYSRTTEGRIMSFLGRAKEPVEGTTLVAATFSQRYRNGQGALRLAPFNFIGGKGTGYRWDSGPITLNLCLPGGPRSARIGADTMRQEPIQDLVDEAWKAWVKEGQIAGRQANLNLRTENIPPFSDVNISCLYSIPDYAYEASNEILTAGLTLPMVNHSLGTLEAAPIFLFERAISRIPGERSYLSTAIHEMGHFFGLGHEFDKDQNGRYKNLSVMAYEENRTVFPTAHDLAALLALFGAASPTSASTNRR